MDSRELIKEELVYWILVCVFSFFIERTIWNLTSKKLQIPPEQLKFIDNFTNYFWLLFTIIGFFIINLN